MMQHYMAGIQKPGIVFWDMNTPEQFGWKYEGVIHANTIMPGGVHIDANLAKQTISKLNPYITTIAE